MHPHPEAPARDVTIDDVHRAAARLDGLAHRTPVLRSRLLDEATGARLHLKAEHLQRVGAFKFRGAANAIAALPDEARHRGVVAYSSGNHAQAIACAARLAGVPATIVLPDDAPAVKRRATEAYGATIVRYDRYAEDRLAIAARIAAESGATVIPPFDHPDVIAGQGTAALELCTEVPELDLLVVPVGGGGLIAGCTVAAAAVSPGTEVVGVEPAGRVAAREALRTGAPVTVPVPRTLLDGQQTVALGELPLQLLQGRVHRVVGVEDDEVLTAVRTLALTTKQVVEPSGASGLAAVLAGHLDVRGAQVGIVLSGGNIAPEVLTQALATGG